MKYLCVFRVHTDLQCTFNWQEVCTTVVPSLEDVRDGFWVNRNCDFTKGSDSLVFIFPKNIQYVRKLTK